MKMTSYNSPTPLKDLIINCSLVFFNQETRTPQARQIHERLKTQQLEKKVKIESEFNVLTEQMNRLRGDLVIPPSSQFSLENIRAEVLQFLISI